jgi:hypothetical protein
MKRIVNKEKFTDKLLSQDFNLTMKEQEKLSSEIYTDRTRRKNILIVSICTIILILLVVSPVYLISFAKYTSDGKSNTSVNIAKWKVAMKINNSEIYSSNNTTSLPFEINLKDTIIANNYSMTKVVPGTKGKIQINLDFSGTEVNAEYAVIIALPGLLQNSVPPNLKFYKDANCTVPYPNVIENAEYQKYLNGTSTFTPEYTTALMAEFNAEKVSTIYWKWNFTDDNENNYQDNYFLMPALVTARQKV